MPLYIHSGIDLLFRMVYNRDIVHQGGIIMIINNVGYNHCHDTDFRIERPEGYGDYLLLLLKTESLFTLNGKEVLVPKNSFFLYKKGTPQYYRCVSGQLFANDWIHFLFEEGEEEAFLSYGIPFDTPIRLDQLNFLSFCVKSIAYEFYSANLNRRKSIAAYMELIFLKVQEHLCQQEDVMPDSRFEMLSVIRNKIYSRPYEPRTADTSAHEVRMSRSSFQHQYKAMFGTTFMEDMICSRMEYAKMLLKTTDLNVSEIAIQCGYHSYAHFARQFRERVDMTPLEYRKRKE